RFDPVVFNCLRFILASLVMSLLYRRVFKDRLARQSWITLIILGFLGNTVYQMFFIFGVKWTHVSHVAILLAVAPIFTAVLSRIMGFEKMGNSIWAGIALSVCGVLLIVFGTGGGEHIALTTNPGDLLIILACLAWSIYTSFS